MATIYRPELTLENLRYAFRQYLENRHDPAKGKLDQETIELEWKYFSKYVRQYCGQISDGTADLISQE